jgi:hypothetical protein
MEMTHFSESREQYAYISNEGFLASRVGPTCSCYVCFSNPLKHQVRLIVLKNSVPTS